MQRRPPRSPPTVRATSTTSLSATVQWKVGGLQPVYWRRKLAPSRYCCTPAPPSPTGLPLRLTDFNHILVNPSSPLTSKKRPLRGREAIGDKPRFCTTRPRPRF